MTLAQNHQQPLNGNKLLLSILMVMLLLASSCSIFQKSTGEGEDITQSERQNPDTAKIPVLTDTVKQTAIVPSIDLAVMLPFFTDSNEVYFLDEEFESEGELSIYHGSSLAIEFYEGITIALDSIKQRSLNFNVHVYDTHNDTSRVKNIFNGQEWEDIDLIIGPVYNKNLRIVAQRARSDKKYLISPLSPSATITNLNPYYVMMNATLQTHCRTLAEYMRDMFPGSNKVVLRQGSNNSEDILIEHFKKGFQIDTLNEVIMTRRTIVDTSSIGRWLIPSKDNLVIIPSFDEAFVSYVTGQLNRLMNSYTIIVAGMPTWKHYRSLRIDYLQKLQAHITDSYWTSMEDQKLLNFRKAYIKAYKTEASEYAVRGFELMMYVQKLIEEYGEDFPKHLDKRYSSIYTDFMISPHYVNPITKTGINYLENQFVHILKYKDYDLVKIN
ncbi:MAG: amino acid ABC transporter substrate-binding protein [Bacteroidetes bacterium]|nr:amino acid ABC transporter substrate-binding protein [Bacteroidota bacterium]